MLQIWNRNTGKLEECAVNNCIYMSEGVNHAPYAAFGGWSGVIAKDRDQQVASATYDFLSFISSPGQSNYDVGRATGFNPYRLSQLNTSFWTNNLV